jgi:hypothetical protein
MLVFIEKYVWHLWSRQMDSVCPTFDFLNKKVTLNTDIALIGITEITWRVVIQYVLP